MNLQTLSEEEQQRVLSEEKIGFKRGSGASSPASKKKNSKTKVRPLKQSPSYLVRCKQILTAGENFYLFVFEIKI